MNTLCCARCGRILDATANFCTECGAAAIARCRNCDQELDLRAKLCSQCGTAQHSAATPSAYPTPHPPLTAAVRAR